MTPKEKANYLINLFSEYSNDEYHECLLDWELKENKLKNAKKCALISVEEKYNDILNFLEFLSALKMITKENAGKIIVDMNKEKYEILSELNN